MNRRLLALTAAAAGLALATVLLFTAVERYEAVTDNLLVNPELAAGFEGWRLRGERPAVRAVEGGAAMSLEAPGVAMLEQVLQRPPGVHHARLSAELRFAGVRAGAAEWQAARLLLVQHDAQGRAHWEFPHQVPNGHGVTDWRPAGQTFYLPARTTVLRVTFGLNQASGTMEVRDLRLIGMAERPAFGVARRAVAADWLALCALAAAALLFGAPLRASRLVVLGVAAAILAGGLLPHTVKSEVLIGLGQLGDRPAGEATKPTAPPSVSMARPVATGGAEGATGRAWGLAHKTGHVLMFVLLALAVRWCWRRLPLWQATGLLLVFAVSAETVQLMTPDRMATPSDAGLNVAGVGLGLVLSLLIARHVAPPQVDMTRRRPPGR